MRLTVGLPWPIPVSLPAGAVALPVVPGLTTSRVGYSNYLFQQIMERVAATIPTLQCQCCSGIAFALPTLPPRSVFGLQNDAACRPVGCSSMLIWCGAGWGLVPNLADPGCLISILKVLHQRGQPSCSTGVLGCSIASALVVGDSS